MFALIILVFVVTFYNKPLILKLVGIIGSLKDFEDVVFAVDLGKH